MTRTVDITPQTMYVDPGTPRAQVVEHSATQPPEEPAPANVVNVAAQPAIPGAVPPPNCEVAFELGEYGELVVAYHRVIVDPGRGLINLVFDTRFKSVGSRFSPARRKEAFNIRFRGETHRVVSLGIEVTLADEHVHVIILLVDDSSSEEAEEDYNKSPAMEDLGPAFNMEMFDGKDR